MNINSLFNFQNAKSIDEFSVVKVDNLLLEHESLINASYVLFISSMFDGNIILTFYSLFIEVIKNFLK